MSWGYPNKDGWLMLGEILNGWRFSIDGNPSRLARRASSTESASPCRALQPPGLVLPRCQHRHRLHHRLPGKMIRPLFSPYRNFTRFQLETTLKTTLILFLKSFLGAHFVWLFHAVSFDHSQDEVRRVRLAYIDRAAKSHA